MCNRASTAITVSELEEVYGAKRNPEFEIENNDFFSYHLNGFAHPEMLLIPQEKPTELHPSIWGIMPGGELGVKQNEYYKKAARFGGGLNARSEKAFEHFIYKHSIFKRRCIIPLTGFFEPHAYKGKKYPVYITGSNDRPLSVAGIYSITKDGFVTTTMLTKKASSLFEAIHNEKDRQIILLDPELEKEWLRDDLNQGHIQELMQVHYDDSSLHYWPVSRDLYKKGVTTGKENIEQAETSEVLRHIREQMDIR